MSEFTKLLLSALLAGLVVMGIRFMTGWPLSPYDWVGGWATGWLGPLLLVAGIIMMWRGTHAK